MIEPVAFVDVLIPGSLHQVFTYQLPSKYANRHLVGYRAIVPLSKTIITGIVIAMHHLPPKQKARFLLAVPDNQPLFDEAQLSFLKWIASYYMCGLGEVIHAAIGGIKFFLEPKISLSASYTSRLQETTKYESLLEKLLTGKKIRYQEAKALLAKRDINDDLLELVEKKIITVATCFTTYLPKVKHILLHPLYKEHHQLEELKKKLNKYPQQLAGLNAYLNYKSFTTAITQEAIPKKKLLKNVVSPYSLKQLIQKNIFVEQTSLGLSKSYKPKIKFDFSEYQHKILLAIKAKWGKHDVVLLQTNSSLSVSSLALQLALQAAEKEQVLYLIPTIKELNLLLSQLKNKLGEGFATYHAGCTKLQKLAVWHAVRSGNIHFIIGTRSALFLPFYKLRYIIVEEEAATAYKQTLKNPRYHARDLAIVLAQDHQAKVLLTSPMPSAVSYYHAKNNKYGWVQSKEAEKDFFLKNNSPKPIKLIPLPFKKHTYTAGYQLAPFTVKLLKDHLANHLQSILIHSRKGYAAYTICQACSWKASCPRCKCHLIYHQTSQKLHCHHCKKIVALPAQCEACSSTALKHQSMGTQQTEELLKFYLPKACIKRLDSDAIGTNKNYLSILNSFKSKKIDVLIATQSLIPLLPTENPCCILVLDIENWLRKPSFYAYEQACQNLAKLNAPTVTTNLVLQTSYKPSAQLTDLIKYLSKENHTPIYKKILDERKIYNYPPYVRLIKVMLTYHHQEDLMNVAEDLSKKVYEHHLHISLLGPTPAILTKNKSYTTDIWLKIPKNKFMVKLKGKILLLTHAFLAQATSQKIHIAFDVDSL